LENLRLDTAVGAGPATCVVVEATLDDKPCTCSNADR
jgi:hypothetical protein